MSKPLDRDKFVQEWGPPQDTPPYGYEKQAREEFCADLDALLAAERERCATVAESAVYMSKNCPEGGSFGGPASCEYGCGHVIAAAIRVWKEVP